MVFILVEPAVPGNVGAAARAIKTMGFRQMRLINPCDYLSREARMFAHASAEILENAEVFGSLSEALSDIDLSIASSAKVKDARLDYHRNTELPGMLKSKGNTVSTVGIVFGREESGLSNNEIRMCDLASTIPMKQVYPSLNLSQAVMIYAYTLAGMAEERNGNQATMQGDSDRKDRMYGQEMTATGREKQTLIRNDEEFRTMMDRSKELLRRIEADRNPALYNRILERIALLGEDDIHLLLSVLSRIKNK
jgi:tRNA/rRNA methyltransferase